MYDELLGPTENHPDHGEVNDRASLGFSFKLSGGACRDNNKIIARFNRVYARHMPLLN